MENIFINIIEKSSSINQIISKIYLPIGLYIELINEFDIIKLLILILISTIPFILLNDLIMIPPFLISAIIYIIKFKIFNYNIIFILLSCIIIPHINRQLGLLINLIFPKLNYNSEVEVVKQSIAVFISMVTNLLFAISIIYPFYKLLNIVNKSLLISIYLLLFIFITYILNKVLNTCGIKNSE